MKKQNAANSSLIRQLKRVRRLHRIDFLALLGLLILATFLSHHYPSQLSTFMTTIAIGVGGWWTYSSFVRKRESVQRARVELRAIDFQLAPELNLVHVSVRVENSGAGLIQLSEVLVRIQLVLPPDDATVSSRIAEKIADPKYNFLGSDTPNTTVEWPLLHEVELSLKSDHGKKIAAIEPGESQTLHADAVLSSDITLVRIYGYVRDSSPQKLGWEAEEFYRIGAGNVQ